MSRARAEKTPGSLGRVRAGVSRRLPQVSRDVVRRRTLEITDLASVARLSRRVDSLEVAVAENMGLAVPLEAQVAELEQTVVMVMEQMQSRRSGA